MARRGLGKGLEALLPQKDNTGEMSRGVSFVSVDSIMTGKHQPRKEFEIEKLEELAQSIRTHGLIQPIIVKPAGENSYEIVAGERRLRACKIAGIKKIPAIIKEVDARETAEIALIENLQREDLNQIEEAEAYYRLIEEYHLTQDEIARRVGKSRPAIANTMRLLQLPVEVQEMLKSETITTGHAKIILGVKDKQKQIELAKIIEKEGLTVRQTENLIKKWEKERKEKSPKKKKIDIETEALERRLQQIFTTKVKLKRSRNNNRIEIYFYSSEELERILAVLLNKDVPRGTS